MPVADITNAAGETTVGVMTAIKDGFGNTLKSTGIIIGLGVMMGGILEVSGAAEQLAFTFIRVIGNPVLSLSDLPKNPALRKKASHFLYLPLRHGSTLL